MIIARKLGFPLWLTLTLLLLSGCANFHLNYEEPSVALTSFKALPINGFEQNFEVGLTLINPNNFELPLNGISYQLSVAGESLAHGVLANIPTVGAYSESRFVLPVSASLIGGIKVIKALFHNKERNINYQLTAKLDINIPLVPKLTIIQEGVIPLARSLHNNTKLLRFAEGVDAIGLCFAAKHSGEVLV